MERKQKLTTEAGTPVGDNQNIQTAGPQDPALLTERLANRKIGSF